MRGSRAWPASPLTSPSGRWPCLALLEDRHGLFLGERRRVYAEWLGSALYFNRIELEVLNFDRPPVPGKASVS